MTTKTVYFSPTVDEAFRSWLYLVNWQSASHPEDWSRYYRFLWLLLRRTRSKSYPTTFEPILRRAIRDRFPTASDDALFEGRALKWHLQAAETVREYEYALHDRWAEQDAQRQLRQRG